MRDDKRGLVGYVILGVIFVVLLVLIIVGSYFYNFHVFKTLRVCVGDGVDTEYVCADVQDCIDAADEAGIDIDSYNLDGAPEFIQEKFDEVLDEVVYCDVTCFVRDVRGVDAETQEIEMLESCEVGESEIVVEIRGKEGLAIMRYMKSLEE